MLVPVNSKHKTALAAKIQLSDRCFLSIIFNSPWTFLVCILFSRVYTYYFEKLFGLKPHFQFIFFPIKQDQNIFKVIEVKQNKIKHWVQMYYAMEFCPVIFRYVIKLFRIVCWKRCWIYNKIWHLGGFKYWKK